MPRLFSGIELPLEICDQLVSLAQPLPSTRWIQKENLHITLRFIGDVSPPVAHEFSANLAALTFDPFPIRLSGLASFGGDSPRLLFAAVEPSEPLTALARAHERAARQAGLAPESRRFTPHLSLARLQSPRIEPIARWLSKNGGFRTEPFLVDQFALFSSKPKTGGGPYVVEQTFPSSQGSFSDIEWDDDDARGYGSK